MTASNRDSEVFWNADGHLRAYPYAIGIYALAMHLTRVANAISIYRSLKSYRSMGGTSRQ